MRLRSGSDRPRRSRVHPPPALLGAGYLIRAALAAARQLPASAGSNCTTSVALIRAPMHARSTCSEVRNIRNIRNCVKRCSLAARVGRPGPGWRAGRGCGKSRVGARQQVRDATTTATARLRRIRFTLPSARRATRSDEVNEVIMHHFELRARRALDEVFPQVQASGTTGCWCLPSADETKTPSTARDGTQRRRSAAHAALFGAHYSEAAECSQRAAGASPEAAVGGVPRAGPRRPLPEQSSAAGWRAAVAHGPPGRPAAARVRALDSRRRARRRHGVLPGAAPGRGAGHGRAGDGRAARAGRGPPVLHAARPVHLAGRGRCATAAFSPQPLHVNSHSSQARWRRTTGTTTSAPSAAACRCARASTSCVARL